MNWEYEVYVAQVGREGIVVRPELNPAEFKAVLNHYGASGWELVAVFDVNMLQGGSKQVVATFKRPRPEGKTPTPPPLPT
ncbi:MAG: DUF4177 domain-containing protein [Lentisphaerae bacterium]|nr:DUF4177 domain-containing protein [Lentisphaerota bacterium]